MNLNLNNFISPRGRPNFNIVNIEKSKDKSNLKEKNSNIMEEKKPNNINKFKL